jgi:hypothetical protein
MGSMFQKPLRDFGSDRGVSQQYGFVKYRIALGAVAMLGLTPFFSRSSATAIAARRKVGSESHDLLAFLNGAAVSAARARVPTRLRLRRGSVSEWISLFFEDVRD